MTEEEVLVRLINGKGVCPPIFCHTCPIQKSCESVNSNIMGVLKSRRQIAIEKYIDTYGKENLMELLL